jgi:hypothetical protein
MRPRSHLVKDVVGYCPHIKMIGPYTLAVVAQVAHDGRSRVTSGDMKANPVSTLISAPEPASTVPVFV